MADGTFFGGTALSRTVLSSYRLSEDIDVIVEDAPQVARELQEWLPRALRHEYRLAVELQRGEVTEQAIVHVDEVQYPLKVELSRLRRRNCDMTGCRPIPILWCRPRTRSPR